MAAGKQGWSLERVLFALAGTVTLISATLAVLVSKWFVLLAALVGVNQWLFVLTGSCPASLVLRRSCRFQSATYDNRDRADVRTEEVTV